ncbi:ribonuclease domain-containing protein [Oceanobacillus sp. CAU 1775]
MKRFLSIVSVLIISLILTGCSVLDFSNESIEKSEVTIDENGSYTSMDEVALYLYTFGNLPKNYITKSEASELGWISSEGNLWEVTDQKSIGGDRFGNREGNLPDKAGRQYYEADINYQGGYRGAERIVFSNDGLIYYTADHYETFTLLYGDE